MLLGKILGYLAALITLFVVRGSLGVLCVVLVCFICFTSHDKILASVDCPIMWRLCASREALCCGGSSLEPHEEFPDCGVGFL
jgi:hypothetical protein